MKKTCGFIFVLICFCCSVFVSDVFARNQAFYVPDKLKGRVNFWVDIYTKYGKHHYVLHHRAYPQVVFKVLDFNPYVSSMSAVKLERYKEQVKTQEVQKILNIIRGFSLGRYPQNSFEQSIWDKVIKLPGGKTNFSAIYKDKLVRAQAGIREEFIESIKRSGKYIGIMEKIFTKEYNLPLELTRIPFVESSFNYKASSAAGATGIWQFMRRTGVSLGMNVNNAVDERRDPVLSTRGAAKYLKSNYSQLGSWDWAITSYNHGASGVKRKIKEYGSRDIGYIVEHPTKRLLGFASNNFYAEFLAALEVYENRRKYFPNVSPDSQLSFVQYSLHYPIKVSEVSRRLGIEIGELQIYNYALTSKTLAGYYLIPKGYKLKLPTRLANQVSLLNAPDKSVRYATSKSAWEIGDRYYTVRRGDSLGSISRHFSMNVSELKKLNGLKNDKIFMGQKLLVSKKKSAVKQTYNTSGTIYTIRSGDSLIGISRKYGVSVATLKSYNNLRSDIVKIGQKIKIPTSNNVGRSASVSYVSSGSGEYVVKKGDTLLSISIKNQVSVNDLKKVNNLNSTLLSIGQKLKIPSSSSSRSKVTSSKRTYKVGSGDTLWSISKKYGVSVDAIKKVNKISGRSGIRAGSTLIIP